MMSGPGTGPGAYASAETVSVTAGESGDGWIAKTFTQARKYKKLYAATRESYDGLRTLYEATYDEWRTIEEKLLLQMGNEEDFRNLRERELNAWWRLYQRPEARAHPRSLSPDHGHRKPDTAARILYLPRFEPGEDPELSGNFLDRWVNRYRIYKSRYEAIQEAREILRSHTAILLEDVVNSRRKLQAAASASRDTRSLFTLERDAWQRLYTE